MTGDFAGEQRAEDLRAVFAPYLAAAAGSATDAGDEEAAHTLQAAEGFDVAVADPPVTIVDGDTRVAVDVTLYVPNASRPDPSARDRLARLLSEASARDGYHVRRCDLTEP